MIPLLPQLVYEVLSVAAIRTSLRDAVHLKDAERPAFGWCYGRLGRFGHVRRNQCHELEALGGGEPADVALVELAYAVGGEHVGLRGAGRVCAVLPLCYRCGDGFRVVEDAGVHRDPGRAVGDEVAVGITGAPARVGEAAG